MQTSEHTTPTPAAAERPTRHHTLVLPSPWDHQAPVELRGFVPEPSPEHPHLAGCTSLTVDGGAFALSLRPSAPQLRAMAALLLALASDVDGVTPSEAAS